MLNALKPSLLKIFFMFVFVSVSSVVWRIFVTSRISDTFPMGFPFQFYLSWGPCQPGQVCSEFNGVFLIFDLLLWYIVSAIVVNRFGKR